MITGLVTGGTLILIAVERRPKGVFKGYNLGLLRPFSAHLNLSTRLRELKRRVALWYGARRRIVLCHFPLGGSTYTITADEGCKHAALGRGLTSSIEIAVIPEDQLPPGVIVFY